MTDSIIPPKAPCGHASSLSLTVVDGKETWTTCMACFLIWLRAQNPSLVGYKKEE